MVRRIVISEFMDDAAVEALRPDHDVVYDPTLVDRPDALAEAVGRATALIVRNRTQVRGDLLAAATDLRVVGRLGVGLDNIDTDACADRGIAVIPAIGANAAAVAEYVVAALFTLFRPAPLATDRTVAGTWPRTELIGREVAGKTLGLIGYGSIARKVADRATALGMSVLGFDSHLSRDDPSWQVHHTRPADLDSVLGCSDAVSLHVPLTDTTRHLIDADALARMRPRAVLINTARGGVVDDAALAAALRDGRLGGAALDVFETEPLPADSVFAGCPNLIATPHVAGVTVESNQRVSALIADKIRAALKRP